MAKESRRIVLILGNGFDLDLGLKTSYKDFWESEYCPKDYPAPLIHHLNQCWPDSLDSIKWYDLENELYNYAKNLFSDEPRKDIITDEEREYIRHIKNDYFYLGTEPDYVNQIKSLFDKGILYFHPSNSSIVLLRYKQDLLKSPVERDTIALDLIKKKLLEYLSKIGSPQDEKNTVAYRVLQTVLNAAENGNIVEIYTFNYTPLTIFGYKVDSVPVHYMHGSCEDGKIIVGTRDDKDIEEEYVFLQKAFDPNFYPPHLVSSLQDADDVIIFGHSIGENDRQYFKSFFMHQTNYSRTENKRITIFTKDHKSEIHIKIALQNMTDGNLSTLSSLNEMPIIKTDCLKEDSQHFLDFLLHYVRYRQDAEVMIGDLIKTYRQKGKQ